MAAFRHGRNDFVIGEAGGYQDFLWGFGIRHAFTTGYLAAQAILNGQDWQAVELKIRQLRSSNRPDCAGGCHLQRLLEVPAVGVLVATALVAAIGNGSAFEQGRHFAA